MTKLTHGGLKEPWFWEDRTYKMLGEILFKLCAGDSKKRREAYISFYEMKRHFYSEVFENYIERLDMFRIGEGFTTMRELIKIARSEMVELKDIIVDPVPFTEPKNFSSEALLFKERLKVNIKSEQLSLF